MWKPELTPANGDTVTQLQSSNTVDSLDLEEEEQP